MTSIEFVIWMRGFMAHHRKDYIMDAREVETIRLQLSRVDGVPTPREKRTNLCPPVPVLAKVDEALDGKAGDGNA